MRENKYLRQKYAAILSMVGVILGLASLFMLIPLIMLFFYAQDVVISWFFVVPAIVMGISGTLIWKIFHLPTPITFSVHEGGIIILISWIAVIFISAVPFLSLQDIGFSRALFESVSAWTTTGLSTIDVSKANKMVLLWRSLMQMAGGAGLAIIMISTITSPVGMGISSAEGRSDQLVPHVRRSARLVLTIYIGYTVIGAFSYWLVGMSIFDAVNHAFAAVSTGGFSTHVESIGYWNSPAIEAVTIVLMLLGNLSFVTAWFLWRGKLRVVIRNGEVRLITILIPLAASLIFLLTCRALYPQIGKSVRITIFHTISALTSTGFSTVSFNEWNDFGKYLIVILMLIGGGTCSTAGGIKQSRIYLLLKSFFWEIKRALMPRAAVIENYFWDGNRRVFVNDEKIRHVFIFVFTYLTFFLLGTMILCACGYPLLSSFFEFASALGTVGLSIGITSPDTPNMVLWIESLAMFLGRLEFFVVILSLIKLGSETYRVLSCPFGKGA